ncbi:S9 family peptidase [Kroppenstedtia guangzhouensis]|uniref:S9 family peptidase n=1 Tax=Kroppenstedtia guangzhouensis TaxID=1274356 RepID=UPI00166BA075|nr:S9 family peptidase [Kroppenstedtia guangzhouensis]
MIRFPQPDVEQFFRTMDIQTFAVRPDERQIVFSTNLGGSFDLWQMDPEHPFPSQMTFIGQSCQALHFEKRGRFLMAGFDQDGDENTQLYALPPEGGELLPIRRAEGKRHFFASLSDDGKRLYYTTNRENETHLDTFCYDLETEGEKKILAGSEAATFLVDVSPEEKTFAYLKHFSNTHALLFVQQAGEAICLTADSGPQHVVYDAVYTDENTLYFLTDYQEDRAYLAQYDLQRREFQKVLEPAGGEFTSLSFDRKGKVLYLVEGYGVEDRLIRFSLDSSSAEEVTVPVEILTQLVIAKSGTLYLLGRSAVRPHNLYRLRPGESKWSELTRYRVPGVAEETLVQPEVMRYPSYDGLEIEALWFRAREEVSNGYLILWPHGGPQAAERKSFRALFQFLLHRGYSVFAPNFRGSTGYGLSFAKRVEGDWGGGPRLDLIHGLEWMIEQGYADRSRILLMGGSYGGYMSLLLTGRHGSYFRAVVDIFGPSDLFTFIESVPEHWQPVMEQWVGDPVKDRDKLKEDSPITYLEQMELPMLVVQGAKDPRVVKGESDRIVDALRKKGVDVEYLVLEDEGHGFSKKKNEMEVYRRVLRFLDRQISTPTSV